MTTLPIVFGCFGYFLTEEEKNFFKAEKPIGIILFKRNFKSKEQAKALIFQIKECIGDDCYILIDQEGGRVSRLQPPVWRELKPASFFKNKEEIYENALVIGEMLSSLGINTNTIPCLDLNIEGSHEVIGNRSFSSCPIVVYEFGKSLMEGLNKKGIMPIIKHIPGHGRSKTDSHKELPIIDLDIKTLKETDFLPFKKISNDQDLDFEFWAMTAHIIYSSIDDKNPTTHSQKIINEVIKDFIGFKGKIITDCLTMEALKGSYYERGINALKAGCDILLYCGVSMSERIEIVKSFYDYKKITKRLINI